MVDSKESSVDVICYAATSFDNYSASDSHFKIKQLILEAKKTDDSRLEAFVQSKEEFNDLTSEDVDTLTERNESNLKLANHDGLTGFYNKRFFDLSAGRLFTNAKERGKTLCILFLDGDDFKKVNDTYGHNTGDEVLKYIASGIRDNLRTGDLYARYGGEEFIVAAPDTDCETGYMVAERIRKYFENNSIDIDGDVLAPTVSIGVACVDKDCRYLTDVIQNADKALYEAKDGGKNRVEINEGEK